MHTNKKSGYKTSPIHVPPHFPFVVKSFYLSQNDAVTGFEQNIFPAQQRFRIDRDCLTATINKDFLRFPDSAIASSNNRLGHGQSIAPCEMRILHIASDLDLVPRWLLQLHHCLLLSCVERLLSVKPGFRLCCATTPQKTQGRKNQTAVGNTFHDHGFFKIFSKSSSGSISIRPAAGVEVFWAFAGIATGCREDGATDAGATRTGSSSTADAVFCGR